jgi:formylmethanofuran dehydrogenase subunit D
MPGSKDSLQAKFIPVAKRTGEPPRLDIPQSDENLNVSIDQLVITNGPGSWVQNAGWDEYILTVRNVAADRVSITQVRLIDPRGVYVDRQVNPLMLQKMSIMLGEEYKSMGVEVVATVGTTTLATLAPLAAAPVLPLVALASPIYTLVNMKSQAENSENIQAEFERRQFGQINMFTLAPAATASGSIFVPIVPNPKALVIDYTTEVGGTPQRKVLELSLEKLQGLHVQTAEEQTRKKAEAKGKHGAEKAKQPEGSAPH